MTRTQSLLASIHRSSSPAIQMNPPPLSHNHQLPVVNHVLDLSVDIYESAPSCQPQFYVLCGVGRRRCGRVEIHCYRAGRG